MKQICRKILITEYLGYRYLTYHQHLQLLYQVTKISFFVLLNIARSMWGLLSSLSFFLSRNKKNKGG